MYISTYHDCTRNNVPNTCKNDHQSRKRFYADYGGPSRGHGLCEHELTEVDVSEYNERVATVALDMVDAIRERLEKHQVDHGEYRAAWSWLMGLAESGEVPLFLDVFFEAEVERNTYDGKPGSQGAVQGPFYVEDAPELTRPPFVLPMRADEAGEPMVLTGRLLTLSGTPLAGATVDMWQAGNDGSYSGFVGDVPKHNLRGRMTTDADGRFRVRTIRPAPYRIPYGGPTGEFLTMVGRHPWRPAHFHFTLSAQGHEPLTTQLYFHGDEWLEGQGDVVGAVKDSLIIDVKQVSDEATAAEFGLPVQHLAAEYEFMLRPAR
jgi:catechol 1,2-dioxygenase